jgi:hypothetical protein
MLPSSQPLWPGRWAEHNAAFKLLKHDLAQARSSWIAEATSPEEREQREASDFLAYRNRQGETVDFHSLRHRFVTAVVQSGASPKQAQLLARHSSITLTMDRYAHVGQAEQAEVLARVHHSTSTKRVPKEYQERATLSNCEESDVRHADAGRSSQVLVLQGVEDNLPDLKKVHPRGVEPLTFGSGGALGRSLESCRTTMISRLQSMLQWHASLARNVARKCLELRGSVEFRGPFHKTPRGAFRLSDNEVSTDLTMGFGGKWPLGFHKTPRRFFRPVR